MSNLSCCYTQGDLTQFNPVEYFAEYHYFEKFDKDKEYNNEIFEQDFGHGERKYRYQLYVINEQSSGDETKERKSKKYIIVKEQLSEDEITALAPYCRCPYHVMNWYNPLRFLTCRCCVGCLDSPFPQAWVINQSREYMKEQNIKDEQIC